MLRVFATGNVSYEAKNSFSSVEHRAEGSLLTIVNTCRWNLSVCFLHCP